ncbi:hypothetical protein [Catellatospora paridis]|uniref:hypothetical protein n=1 Tax=Catellatospora paridis TaxID=1617086 RepID=UPI0012D48FCD|nr:hypothetical protein [Catellatospora paridis]
MTIAGRCRITGFAVGVGIAFGLAHTYLFDLAPVGLALPFAIGVLAGQLASPRRAAGRGMASLRTRRIRDYVPRDGVVAIGVMAVALLLASVYPAPPAPSAEIRYFGTAAPVTLTSTLATLAVLGLLTWLAVWALVRSPQAGADETEHAADEVWRRTTVNTIVTACATCYAAVFTACAFWFAQAQLDWRGGGTPAAGYVLAILGGIGLVLTVRFGAAMSGAQPSPRTDVPGSHPVRAAA